MSLSKPDRSRSRLRSGASLLEALIDFRDVSKVLTHVREIPKTDYITVKVLLPRVFLFVLFLASPF